MVMHNLSLDEMPSNEIVSVPINGLIVQSDNQDAFRTKLELDIRELSFRLDDPTDPELPALLTSIRERYFVKIPEIEEVIREELVNSGCTHLLDQLQPATAGAGGGLWTPEKEETKCYENKRSPSTP